MTIFNFGEENIRQQVTYTGITTDISAGDLIAANPISGEIAPFQPKGKLLDNADEYYTDGSNDLDYTSGLYYSLNTSSDDLDFVGSFANGNRVYCRRTYKDEAFITTASGEFVSFISDISTSTTNGWAIIDEENDQLIVFNYGGAANKLLVTKFDNTLSFVSETEVTTSNSFYPMQTRPRAVNNSSTFTLTWWYSNLQYWMVLNKSNTITTQPTSAAINTSYYSYPVHFNADGWLWVLTGASAAYLFIIDDTDGTVSVSGNIAAFGPIHPLNWNDLSDKCFFDSDLESRYRLSVTTNDYYSVYTEGNDVFAYIGNYIWKFTWVDGSTVPGITTSKGIGGSGNNRPIAFTQGDYIYFLYLNASNYLAYVNYDTVGETFSNEATLETSLLYVGYLWGIGNYIVTSGLTCKIGTDETHMLKFQVNEEAGTLTKASTQLTTATYDYIFRHGEFLVGVTANATPQYTIINTATMEISKAAANLDVALTNAGEVYSKLAFPDSSGFKLIGTFSAVSYVNMFSARIFPIGVIGAALTDVTAGSVDVLVQGWGELNDEYAEVFKAFDHTAGYGNKGIIMGTHIKLLGGS